MKRYYSIPLVGLLFLLSGAAVYAEDTTVDLESLKSDIFTTFRDEAKEVSAVVDGKELRVNYRTRKFFVHNGSKTGAWSEKTSEVVGPSGKGIMIRVVIQATSVPTAWDRLVNDSGATIEFKSRAPYWDTLTWVMPLEGRKHNVLINLSYGAGVNSGTLNQLKGLFGRIR